MISSQRAPEMPSVVQEENLWKEGGSFRTRPRAVVGAQGKTRKFRKGKYYR